MVRGVEKKKWVVAAAFFNNEDDIWLNDFIVDDEMSFEKVLSSAPNRDWHKGRSKFTPLRTWLSHFLHARSALRKRPDGVITCFPQLAICAAFWKRIGGSKPLIIAYNFNLGALKAGPRQFLARAVAKQVDCFVVHSPEEVVRYAEYLDVSTDRVQFVPLQRGKINTPRMEDKDAPFIVALGSAHRDYPTLIEAVDQLNLSTVIVTRASDIAALPESANVTYQSGLTEQECIDLMARAKICVTPIANMTTASGQITFINAMQLGVPVIATRCPGTDGYIQHRQDGILVKPFDVEDLAAAITELWGDETLRITLAVTAAATAQERFSDQAAADRLHEIQKALMTNKES